MNIHPELSTAVVISVDPQGRVKSLYSDKIQLGFLGNQHIKREAEIRFDEFDQTWSVFYCGDNNAKEEHFPANIFGGFTTYEEARQFEVVWLNHCYLQSVAPYSRAGIDMAIMLRDSS